MSSDEVVKLEKSWNVSIRRMFNLPWATHCYLVEPISDQPHVRTLLARRFLTFVQAIRRSKKSAIRSLLRVIEFDTRSATGNSLKSILLKTKFDDIKQLKSSDVKAMYRDAPASEQYRVGFIKEIIAVKNNILEMADFSAEELDDILLHLCVS